MVIMRIHLASVIFKVSRISRVRSEDGHCHHGAAALTRNELAHAAWLGEAENVNFKGLLVPYPADQMRIWKISPRINSPKNDDPSLLEPLHAITPPPDR
jgi:hypothetical protein